MTKQDKQFLFPTVTFACGPGQGLFQVRNSLLKDTYFERSHRALDVSTNGLLKQAKQNLRTLLQIPEEYEIIFFVGSATNAMDSVVWNLGINTISGLSFGAFSNRWFELAKRMNGLNLTITTPLKSKFYTTQFPNLNADLLLLTPNETSTGVQLPNSYLENIWNNKKQNSLVVWDATSCAGGRLLPATAYDVMLFGLQKCFGGLGGSSILVLSPKAIDRIKQVSKIRKIPFSLDLLEMLRYAQKDQTLTTPSLTSIWMLNEACEWMNEHGGIKAMDVLCRKHAQAITNWINNTDYLKPLIDNNEFRSYTSYTLAVTNTRTNASLINEGLAKTGLKNLLDGIKPHSFAPANSLRISCFPFVDIDGTEQYERLFRLIDEIVKNG